MPRLPAPALSLVLALGACAPAGEPPVDVRVAREELLAADRAFAARTQESGLDGWMEFHAPDAARLPQLGRPAVRGLEAIRRSDAPLFENPSVRLHWEPADAGVFDDGRHGFTTGTYRLLEAQPDGSDVPRAQGSYLTWWRRDAGGRWLVVLDTGAPDPPPPPASP